MAYAERKKEQAKPEDRAGHEGEVERWLADQRKRIWEMLSTFVSAHGGKVVSVPGRSPMRIEVSPTNVALPDQLTQFGFAPSYGGKVSTFDGKGFVENNVILIDLPRPRMS